MIRFITWPGNSDGRAGGRPDRGAGSVCCSAYGPRLRVCYVDYCVCVLVGVCWWVCAASHACSASAAELLSLSE